MKTITKIATQKKATNRFNIYLDDEYAFSVSEDVLIKHHLHKGMQLSEEEIEKITQADFFHKFYVMAIRYLSYRMRSEQEMRNYLLGKDVSNELIEEIIGKLKTEKLLKDEDFALAFLQDRILHSSKVPKLIAQELRKKGISDEIIKNVMKRYTKEEQLEKALKLAQKHIHKKSSHSFQKRMEQLKVRLMQNGFSKEIINDVIAKVHSDFEVDPDVEYEKLEVQADKLYRKYRKKYHGFELIQKLKEGLFRRGFDLELINKYIEMLEEER